MPQSPPRVLFVDDDVSELLVLRRLCRETPYTVDTVRSASQAIDLLAMRDYAAVVIDPARVTDLPLSTLLRRVDELRPGALRVLLDAGGRAEAWAPEVGRGWQLIPRPFIARPLLATLTALAAKLEQRARADSADDTERWNLAPLDVGAETEPSEARQTERRLLLTLAEVAEAKSSYASGHGARVSALAGLLARQIGLTEEEIGAVEDAALIHDVGDLAVAPALLQLERRLDAQEEEAVRLHVQASHRIACRAGVHPLARAAVLHHHERIDGAGYPEHLAGEAIPVGARLIAVADTWDALATDRPYRRAVGLDACVRQLELVAGSQLDAKLVAAFLQRRLHDLIDWSEPPRPGVRLL
jgi:response regulator RpfG family c-di-GMP phosphodiesterase